MKNLEIGQKNFEEKNREVKMIREFLLRKAICTNKVIMAMFLKKANETNSDIAVMKMGRAIFWKKLFKKSSAAFIRCIAGCYTYGYFELIALMLKNIFKGNSKKNIDYISDLCQSDFIDFMQSFYITKVRHFNSDIKDLYKIVYNINGKLQTEHELYDKFESEIDIIKIWLESKSIRLKQAF